MGCSFKFLLKFEVDCERTTDYRLLLLLLVTANKLDAQLEALPKKNPITDQLFKSNLTFCVVCVLRINLKTLDIIFTSLLFIDKSKLSKL
jgi:hypothetical protein